MAQPISPPLYITNINISEVTDKSAVITWETNRPSDSLVEYEVVQPASTGKAFVHPSLKTKEKTGVESCYGCHPKEKLGLSHPVKVSLRLGMKKPMDLPLGEREDVLCTTCHDPHGGNQKYLVRKDRKRELCISCHDLDKSGKNISRRR
jgi:predicted CXXCH cytochrome family protein